MPQDSTRAAQSISHEVCSLHQDARCGWKIESIPALVEVTGEQAASYFALSLHFTDVLTSVKDISIFNALKVTPFVYPNFRHLETQTSVSAIFAFSCEKRCEIR